MEDSSESQLAIIILKIGFHLEPSITSTSVAAMEVLVAYTAVGPVNAGTPLDEELPNHVTSIDNDKDE